MAIKVLNPLILLPLFSSVCVMTLWNHWFWYQRGERESVHLPAHTPVHWLALLDLDPKKKHLRHIYHQYCCLLEQTSEILYVIPFVLAFTMCWLDPLRHLSSSRSAGSRRDTSSFGGETFFHRNLQGVSETKQSWPAPGCGAKWILAVLHLTDTDKEWARTDPVCLSSCRITTAASRILPASDVVFF